MSPILPKSCERVRGRLDRYVDADLPSLEEARDEGHLEACAECQAELARLLLVLDSVGDALVPPPAEVEAALQGALGRLDEVAEPRFRWRILSGRAGVAIGTAAAALLLMVALDWTGRGLDEMTKVRSEELVPDVQLRLPEWSRVVDGLFPGEPAEGRR